MSKRFGGRTVVREASFEVPSGTLTYLLGPNGAGKTTLLRMVAGLVRPESGEVVVDGIGLADRRRRAPSVGVGLGPFSCNPTHTAEQHLRWQARLRGVGDSEVVRVLRRVGLRDVAGRRVGGFSLGMSQRLVIGSALLGAPHVVVLDEPGTGLDVDGVLWLRDLLAELTAAGTTLLVASHDLTEVEATACRVVVMGRGRVLADNSRDEFVAQGGGPRPAEAAYIEITRGSVDHAVGEEAG
ncbi:ATP-binding cassette domain-containing protein [Tsukamurella sp. 8F]|uniref:ABC transporter ATP-binding protein n=1 Tax=unclassified Tsukamurella TaxID=2633480 RepID=UPI0023B88FE3|nr:MULTISPECIES: ATP-binding cassette domain-containing protein [unclassified Tsukamurella]MDF0529205.1 ATP-binding cassette domain-containing protein [Tsukamurella sp. 8J]MDF0585390.1 ATP-binding cassette domain-containing protein [Tsukamurella sp. 8F]